MESNRTKIQRGRYRALTPGQLAIWTGCQLAPDIPAYNMIMTFEINGHIEAGRFQKAFTRMLEQTDSLRTSFIETEEGIPAQEVSSFANYHLRLVDFRSTSSPDEAIENWISNAATQPMDLSKCCFKSALLLAPGGKAVWFLSQHHLVTDERSTHLIYDRVRKAYASTRAGGISLTRVYDEYQQYMKRYLSSDRYESDRAYWTAKLQNPVEPLHLYGNTQAKASKTCRVSLCLGKERSLALQALARQAAFSDEEAISRVFTTIVFAYLNMVSGNTRIGLGVSMDNRSPNHEVLAGLMMEVCPLIVEFGEDETFNSLFVKANQEFTDSKQHSKFSTHNSVHARNLDVSLGFSSSVFKGFEGTTTASKAGTGLQFMPDSNDRISAWVAGENLAIIVNDLSVEANYRVDLDFNVGLYCEDTQQRAAGHLLRVIDAFIAQHSDSLDAINLLSAQERQRLLVDFNQTQKSHKRRSLIQVLEHHALERPDKVAVVYDGNSLDYLTLNQHSNQLAHQLKSLGVGPEISVGVCMGRSLEMFIALIATMKCGGAYVPLDPHHPTDRIELVLEDARPSILLVDEKVGASFKVDPNTKIIMFSELWAQTKRQDNLDLDLEEDRLAYTIYTSGSTGRPKGVEVPHLALNNLLYSMATEPGMTEGDYLVSVTTISFDMVTPELYLPLLTGATIEIVDRKSTIDPSRLKHKLKKASIFQATPTTFRMLLLDGWAGDENLRILCGGEAFPRDLADELLERVHSVWNMYGPTETTVWSTLDKVSKDRIVPIGTPIDNTQVYVLNAKRQPVPQGCVGELYIAGAGLARGYHQRAKLTQAVFVSNPFSDNKNARMYRTGDLVRILSTGKLECLGRVDFQVKIRGFRIELGEIETLLGRRVEIEQNVVVVQEINGQKTLVAYVTLTEQIEVSVLQEYLRAKLPAYMVPSYVLTLDELPLTPNGKIDRKHLPMPEGNDIGSNEKHIAPESKTEKLIASVWCDTLNLNKVSIQDCFFEIGGHSLLALEVIHKINQRCNTKLALSAIFETPFISDLAKHIDGEVVQQEASEGASVTTLKKGTVGTPVFCICGIYLYQDLAKKIQTDSAVYGVFLPQETEMWMNPVLEKLPTVQELAAHYITAIRKVQPQGPYCLAGISFGGVLAYEMAQQLHAQGESIKTLALLDPILPRALKRHIPMMIKHHAGRVRTEGLGYVMKVLNRLFRRFKANRGAYDKHFKGLDQAHSEKQEDIGALRGQIYKKATANYDHEIKPYFEKALLFFSDESHNDFVGHKLMQCRGWSTVIEQLDVYAIKGDHLGILQAPNVKGIAVEIENSMKSFDIEQSRQRNH